MKRCIVCGNMGSDDSTVCSVCGNPFIEVDDPAEESSASADPAEGMEEQLREMWDKVQGEDSPAAKKTLDMDALMRAAARKTAGDEAAAAEAPAAEEAAVEEEEAAAEKEEAVKEAAAEKKGTVKEAAAEEEEAAVKEKTAAEEAAVKEETTDKETAADESPVTDTASSAVKEKIPEAAPAGRQPAQRRSRRTKSGPQIYGQETMAEYSGAQGVVRRDVQGGHAAAVRQTEPAGSSGRSAARPPRRPEQPEEAVPRAPRRQETVSTDGSQGTDPAYASASSQGGMGNMQGDASANVPQNQQAGGGRPASQTQRMAAQPYPQMPQGGKHSGAVRRIMEAAQAAIFSPLLIVIALFQTVYFISAVTAIFLRELNYGLSARLLTLLPLPSQISGYATMLQAALTQLDEGALVMNLLLRVPDLLFCIALWALVITVRSAGEKMSGSGFLLMKIAVILNMIMFCIALLLVLVVCVTFVIAAWNTGTTSLIVLAVLMLVAAIIATMAVVMYFFCYLSTIKSVRKNAVNGERYGSVSVYVAVVKMVLALTAIVSILSGIVNSEITGITSGVGKLVWMLLFGIWILKYRSTLGEYGE